MRKFALFALVGLAAVGCGDDGSGGSATGGAATGGASSGGGGADGGAGGAGGSGGAGAGGAAAEPQTGEVFLSSGDFSVVAASFQNNADLNCTTTVLGDCTLSMCTPITTRVSAGTVTVTAPSATFTLEPNDNNFYPFQNAGGPLWQDGESIEVEGTGADVPAFSGSVVGPAFVDFSQPDLTGLDKLVLDTSVDLPIAWTGGTGGKLVVSLLLQYPTNSTTLACSFPADAGQGVMPASALGMLVKPATGLFSIDTSNTTSLSVDNAAITITAQVPAHQGDIPGQIEVELQ